MAHVFISYKREDKAFASEMEKQLIAEGFDVWKDNKIEGGEDWLITIEEQIRQSFATVVVLTPKVLEHPSWVIYEWIFARGAGKSVVPIKLNYFDEKILPYRLHDRNLIDFTSEYQWEKLIERLKRIRNDNGQNIIIPYGVSRQVKAGLENLNSEFPEDKIKGAKLLQKEADPDAVPGLIKILEDDDWSVCAAAAEALGAIGDERGAEPLIECLTKYFNSGGPLGYGSERTPDTKIEDALISIGVRAVSAINKRLNDSNEHIRDHVATILGRIKDKQSVSALITAIDDTYEEARIHKVWALGQIKDETCVPVLVNLLKNDPSHRVKNECLQALSIIGGNIATQALIELLTDTTSEESMAMKFPHTPDSESDISHMRLRESAARFLGEMGNKVAIIPLYNVVVTSSLPLIFNTAHYALCRLVNSDDVDMLITMMQQSKIQGLGADREELLVHVIQSIGTQKALTAAEQWKLEQQSK